MTSVQRMLTMSTIQLYASVRIALGYMPNTLIIALSTPPFGVAMISDRTARLTNEINAIDLAGPQFSMSDCVRRVCFMNECRWNAYVNAIRKSKNTMKSFMPANLNGNTIKV